MFKRMEGMGCTPNRRAPWDGRPSNYQHMIGGMVWQKTIWRILLQMQ